MQPTFKEFLILISEDDAQVDRALMDLQTQINQVDTAINQRTQQLMNQKSALQKRYSLLLKQKQTADRNKPSTEPSQQNSNQQAQQAPSPGSTGAGTPGVQ